MIKDPSDGSLSPRMSLFCHLRLKYPSVIKKIIYLLEFRDVLFFFFLHCFGITKPREHRA